MQVNPIQQKQINFNGRFEHSTILKKSLEKASDSELKKFNTLLKRMESTNDNYVFSLNSKRLDSGFNHYKTRIVRLAKVEPYLCGGIYYTVGKEKILQTNNFTGKVYNGVIKNVNILLEKFYPEENASPKKKKNLNALQK